MQKVYEMSHYCIVVLQKEKTEKTHILQSSESRSEEMDLQ